MKRGFLTAVAVAFFSMMVILPAHYADAEVLELDDTLVDVGIIDIGDLIDVATLTWTPEWTLFLPYSVSDGNYWTGLDIQSAESSSYFNIYFIDGDNTYATNSSWSMTGGQWTGTVESLMPSGETFVNGSLIIMESDYPFAVTKFTGSTSYSSPEGFGFGYQTFYAYSKNSSWPNNKYEYKWAQKLDATDGDANGCDSTRFDCVMGGDAVMDNETGLVWAKDAGAVGDGPYALGEWIGVYNATTGGRGGWRLPTIDELTSLFDSDGGVPDDAPFTNLVSDNYWTSSYCRACSPDTTVWIANPVTGGVVAADSADTGNSNYFWLVRGGK